MKRLVTLSIFIFLSLFSSNVNAATSSTGVVCITKKNAIVVRTGKCKGSETRASLSQFILKGPQGDTGPTGPDAVLGRVTAYTSTDITIHAGEVLTFTQECPAGQVSVGGGCITSNRNASLLASYPYDSSPQAWKCTYTSITGNTTTTITPLVVCVNGG